MKKTTYLALTLMLTVCVFAQTLAAQPPNRGRWQTRRGMSRATSYMKNNDQIRSLLGPTIAPAAAATVRVLGNDRAVALGTVVAADGLIVTKASQLTEKPECQLADGRKLPATVVGRDEATDLALLHVDAKNLTPIAWAAGPAAPGSLVAATGPAEGPAMIGVISDVQQAMPGPGRRNEQHGWLGINLKPEGEGPQVQTVSPESAAEKAGLKNGDQIKRVDGEDVRSADELIEKLSGMPPNKRVTLVVERQRQGTGVGSNPGPLARPPAAGQLGRRPVQRSPLGICRRHSARSGDRAHGLRRSAGRSRRPLPGREHRPRLRVTSYALPSSVVQETVEKIRARAKTP